MFEAGPASNHTLSCSVFNLPLIQCWKYDPGCSFIPDPDLDILPIPNPDPGVKKATGTRIRNTDKKPVTLPLFHLQPELGTKLLIRYLIQLFTVYSLLLRNDVTSNDLVLYISCLR